MRNIELTKLISEAKTHYEKEAYEQEIEVWLKVCKAEPDNPYFKHNLALAYMNTGRATEALALFDYLAANYPKLSRVHNNRAKLLMRMGVDQERLIPSFSLALGLSETLPDFIRHFMNLAAIVAYASDSKADALFDAMEPLVDSALQQVSPKKFLEKNTRFMHSLLAVYRRLRVFREAFASRNWIKAENTISEVCADLRTLGLSNFASGIEHGVFRDFKLCKGTVGELEKFGLNTPPRPKEILENYLRLLREIQSAQHERKDSFHRPLLAIFQAFLMGMVNALEFLAAPQRQFHKMVSARNTLRKLTATVYVDLGNDLESLLKFIEGRCAELQYDVSRQANANTIDQLRDKVWAKIGLFCNGLFFDFREVDARAAARLLGWPCDPLVDARYKLHGFKDFIERQAHKDLIVNGSVQENIGRAILQAFLTYRNYREVPIRGGQADILEFSRDGRFLYETKVWRGKAYYRSGLKEIEQYILGEAADRQLIGVFYVIFDASKTGKAAAYLGGAETKTTIAGHTVEVCVIHTRLPIPSKSKK